MSVGTHVRSAIDRFFHMTGTTSNILMETDNFLILPGKFLNDSLKESRTVTCRQLYGFLLWNNRDKFAY